MTKQEIYENHEKQFLGHVVLHQHENDRKPLTKTDVKLLQDLAGGLQLGKRQMLLGVYDEPFCAHRKSAVENYSAYVGNRWASYCNLSKKTGLFYVSTTNYGIENPLIHLTDTALRKITKQMYEQLEEVMNQLQNEEVA